MFRPCRSWAGLKNGELLSRAAVDFDVFVTADQNLEYQQNLVDQDIAVVVLAAKTNRIEDLRPLVPGLLEVVQTVKSGGVEWVAI